MVSRYKNRCIGLVSILIWCLLAPSGWAVCARDLQKQVEALVQSPSLNSARVGVFASKLDDLANPISNIDGDKYFIPASNLKLFTTAAALEILGSSDRFETSLWLDQNRKTLWLQSSGDPSFNEKSLKSLVQSLVKYLKTNGIKAIASEIKTIPELKGSGLGKGWQWEDLQEYYGAIANSFIINENVLDWTITTTEINQPIKFSWDHPDLAQNWIIDNQAITINANGENSLKVERSLGQAKITITGNLPQNTPPELGATAVPDSQAHFLRLLRSEIIRQGISFTPAIPNSSELETIPQIQVATVSSPTLTELINTANKQSNNLYAEALLRRIGSSNLKTSKQDLNMDSADRGIDIITKFWINRGISTIKIQDGSGLTTLNLVTPKAIAQLLILMANQPVFRNSLAIAGVDGTLKNRLKSAPIQAKTGTLTGVRALSGYMQPSKHPEIVFSIIINNSTLSGSEIIKELDAIANLISTVEVCN